LLGTRTSNSRLKGCSNTEADCHEVPSNAFSANVGFIPSYRSGAKCTLSVTNASATLSRTFPKGSEITGPQGISFSTVNELTIATSSSDTVEVIEGLYRTISENASGDEYEELLIPYENTVNIDNNSYFRVLVNDTEYAYQESFKDSDENSLHYIVRYNSDSLPVIVFGNNEFGRRLNPSDTIQVQFFDGGGILGNSVESGKLDTISSVFTGSSDLTVVNTTNATGGKNNPSLKEIQNTLPGYVSSASGITNILNVAPLLKQNYSYVQSARASAGYDATNKKPTVIVYVLPVAESIIDLTSNQKVELDAFMAENALLGTSWQSASVFEQPFNLELDVLVPNKNDQELKEKEIRDYLIDTVIGIWRQELLTLDRLPTIKEFNDIADKAVSDIDGLNRVDVIQVTKKPTLEELTNGDEADIDVIELTEDAEDGEFIIENTSSTTSDVNFYKPFVPSQISEDFVKDDTKDFTLEQGEDVTITELKHYTIPAGSRPNAPLRFVASQRGEFHDNILISISPFGGNTYSSIIPRNNGSSTNHSYSLYVGAGQSSNDDIIDFVNNDPNAHNILTADTDPIYSDATLDDPFTTGGSQPFITNDGSYVKQVPGPQIDFDGANLDIPGDRLMNFPDHGFEEGNKIQISGGGLAGSGIDTQAVYYVRNPLSDSYQISTTPTGAILDIVGGLSGTNQIYALYIELKSDTKIWKTNQFADTDNWQKQSLLKLIYQDESGVTPVLNTYYGKIISNTENTITCRNVLSLNDSKEMPITLNVIDINGSDGDPQTVVDNGYTNISYKVFRSFVGTNNMKFDYSESDNTWKFTESVTYNDNNTLYTDGQNLIEHLSPNNPFYIEFADNSIDNGVTRFWISKAESVEMKTKEGDFTNTDGILKLRTSSRNKVGFKDNKEVLSLSDEDITINIKTF